MIISTAELEKYFGKEVTPAKMKEQIMSLLDDWKEKQPPERAKAPKKQELDKYQLRDTLSRGPRPRAEALVVYIPRRRLFFSTAGSGPSRVQRTAVFGGSPLTVCPGCAISPASGGGISSRAAPFPKTGKGRGVWVELSY